jgi:hypothetical protein
MVSIFSYAGCERDCHTQTSLTHQARAAYDNFVLWKQALGRFFPETPDFIVDECKHFERVGTAERRHAMWKADVQYR